MSEVPTSEHGYDFRAELERLAGEKVKYCEMPEADLLAEASKQNSNVALLENYIQTSRARRWIAALDAGYLLSVLKEKHASERNWTAFIKNKLSGISQATIYRYLKLAKQYPDPKKVPKNLSLQEFYVESGLVGSGHEKKKKKETSAASSHASPPEDLAERFSSITKLVHAFDDAGAVQEIPEPQRPRVVERLDELIELLSQLRDKLTQSTVAKTDMPKADTTARQIKNRDGVASGTPTAVPLSETTPLSSHKPMPPPPQASGRPPPPPTSHFPPPCPPAGAPSGSDRQPASAEKPNPPPCFTPVPPH